jgi:hypothetical protein
MQTSNYGRFIPPVSPTLRSRCAKSSAEKVSTIIREVSTRLNPNMISVSTLAGIVLLLVIAGATVISIGYSLYIRWAVRTGRRGVESMWAAELIEEQDDAFVRAMRNTPQERLAEFGKMADNKEELRKLTVTHYEQDIHSQIDDNRNA